MDQYINPTSICTGGNNGAKWSYYFAENETGDEYVLIITAPSDPSRAPGIHRVEHDFIVEHERGEKRARLTAQDLAKEYLQKRP